MNILSIRNIYYNTNNLDILSGISLDIKKGECISLIGESGSGKSTLMKLCADLISASKGDILYEGKHYKDYNPIELRKKISYCVQIPYLFGNSVYENLEFPFKIRHEKMDLSKLIYLLNKFNLDESYLEKDINSLSGGEKQRIALIRNLIYTPEILLLDEVTSALDSENTKVIEEYVKELNESGVTVLWITHNLEQSKGIFNKRITISKGEISKVEVIN